jgi:prepilin-type N-terminal cleavage/methylation domain-containing protein
LNFLRQSTPIQSINTGINTGINTPSIQATPIIPSPIRRNHGVTLVELLVVLAVISILIKLSIPSYLNFISKQKISAAETDLVSMAMNMENYLLNHTYYPIPSSSTPSNAVVTSSNITGVSNIQAVLPGWVPAQSADFTYYVWAVDNTVTPPTYTVSASGVSTSVGGSSCILSLNSSNVKSITSCKGVSSW